jgi:hypothetical protein
MFRSGYRFKFFRVFRGFSGYCLCFILATESTENTEVNAGLGSARWIWSNRTRLVVKQASGRRAHTPKTSVSSVPLW